MMYEIVFICVFAFYEEKKRQGCQYILMNDDKKEKF